MRGVDRFDPLPDSSGGGGSPLSPSMAQLFLGSPGRTLRPFSWSSAPQTPLSDTHDWGSTPSSPPSAVSRTSVQAPAVFEKGTN